MRVLSFPRKATPVEAAVARDDGETALNVTEMTRDQRRFLTASAFLMTAPTVAVVFLAARARDKIVEIPAVERLGELTARGTELDLLPVHHPPYRLLLGLPASSAGKPRFSGTIHITDSEERTTELPFDSSTAKESNWLDQQPSARELIGEHGSRPGLHEILERGTIRFEEAPPSGSSLWFLSLRHASGKERRVKSHQLQVGPRSQAGCPSRSAFLSFIRFHDRRARKCRITTA